MAQTVINLHSKDYTEEVIRPAMDVAYVETPGGEVKTISSSAWTENFGTPIGVVVIPKDFLPDGKARIMSLYWVDDETGEITDEAHSTRFSKNNAEVLVLNAFDEVPIIDLDTNTIISKKALSLLPSDYFPSLIDNNTPNPWDIGTAYYDFHAGRYEKSPSPYGTDGALNPLYIAAEYSGGTINNALADFKGKENTDILVGLGSDYIAANIARNYKSYNGDTIEWYLPAIGELGFVCARYITINETLKKINGYNITTTNYWSSTKYNSDNVWSITMAAGIVEFDSITTLNVIRPFAQL